MYARCPAACRFIAQCVGQSGWRCMDCGGDVVQQASLRCADCPVTTCASSHWSFVQEAQGVCFSAVSSFLCASMLACAQSGTHRLSQQPVPPKTLTVFSADLKISHENTSTHGGSFVMDVSSQGSMARMSPTVLSSSRWTAPAPRLSCSR